VRKKFFGAVGFGQFGFRRLKTAARRRRAERIFFAGAADRRRRGLVAFEQNGGTSIFFAGVRCGGRGFGGDFGFGALLPLLPGQGYGRQVALAMQIFRQL
jgi:hypothetical protein